MSHKFYDGYIYHKRLQPTEHLFKYKFFMLDIDLNDFENLETKRFSINKFNLFSFKTKDHFGPNKDFKENIDFLLNALNIKKTSQMRFVTLPSIFGYVFNPISTLILFEDDIPTYLVAEVHNYNGGRVIYPVKFEKNGRVYSGKVSKDMYVSPFFKRDGEYEIKLIYSNAEFKLDVILFEDGEKKLTSFFHGFAVPFSSKAIVKLLTKHKFLTLFVVTRTLKESFKLWRKGLKWGSPTKQDQLRRY